MIILILEIVAFILFLSVFMGVIYLCTGFGKWFYHDIMEWHMPDNKQRFDGCSFTSRCKYCGKEIMQDSQGNWF